MKAFKKLSAFLLFVLLALSLFVCVSADNISDGEYDLSVAGAYEFAESFLTEYYRAMDLDEPYDFTKYIQISALNTYISGRVQSCWNAKNLYGWTPMRNYCLTVSLSSAEVFSDCIKLNLGIRATFTYAGANFESSYGESMIVLVSGNLGNYQICDVHSNYEPYFYSYRKSTTVSDPNYWYSVDESALIELQQQNIAAANEYAAQQAQAQAEADALAAQMAAEQTEEEANNSSAFSLLEESTDSSIEPTSTSSTLYSLNKTAIVNWARANFNQEHPITGNASLVPVYLDFATYGNNWDCTNFASHALLAGGAVFNEVGSSSNDTAWYYYNDTNRSRSWSGVERFYNFLTSNTTQGPAGYVVPYVIAPAGVRQFDLGDIAQFRAENDIDWTHTTIITAFIGQKPCVTGRSAYLNPNNHTEEEIKEVMNDNVLISAMQVKYSVGTRIIYLTGNYQ